MKILVVDDDPYQCELLKATLTQAGHQVITLTNGHAAWDLLQSEAVQLVITDWLMPGLVGPDLIRQIRAADYDHYIYTILLTIRNTKEDVVRGLESGADDYLTKPFYTNELLARVAIGERILNLERRLKESLERLQVLASHDSLTGLLNRRTIYDHAQVELARALREGHPLSLALLDVDQFKTVNDRYGHMVGDEALRLIANTILENRRPYDWVGRWGGEEFLVVLPGTELRQARLASERIRTKVAESRLELQDGDWLQLRVSIGVTGMSPGADPTLDKMIHQADEALYQAKRQGGNQVCEFQP